MSTPAPTLEQSRPTGVVRALTDGWVVAKRNLIKIKRVPEVLVFVLISPIMFVLLFAYVFGATFPGAGLAEDMQKGITDRSRSLPMSQAAVLVGRTTSDVVYNVLSLAIMALTGLLVGWRIREGFLDAVLGFALLLLFAYAVSWVMAWVGLMVPSVEVINNASFIVIMPLTFVSNAFVPLESFSGVLRTLVEWNPVSALTQASRELFGNVDPRGAVPDAWSMQHPVLYTLLWVAIILVVFVPLSVRRYRLSAGTK